MKLKRGLFVIVLIALFALCYAIMNQHYDELARYPHELNEKERSLVLQHLDTDEINMLISQKIEPDQFIPYIEIEGFDLSNTLWYDSAYLTQKENISRDFIVRFINKYKNRMNYTDLKDIITNYSFNKLIRFFDEGDTYINSATLLSNPSARYTRITNKQTLYTYEPSDLVSIGALPHDSILLGENDILVKSEIIEPLTKLLEAANDINGEAYGGMQVVTGYLSYENQVKLLDIAKEMYANEFSKHWDYPGHSEFQLGYSIQLLPNGVQAELTNKEKDDTLPTSSSQEREQEIWLKDNAYKYGFIIRYPKDGEDETDKVYQPYILRYVGKELAKEIHTKSLTLEQVNTSKYE